MMWSYWMALYLRTHCVARGLSPLAIAAYEAAMVRGLSPRATQCVRR